MLAAGVYLPPSAFDAWFVSTTHGDVEIDQVARAAAAWAQSAARGSLTSGRASSAGLAEGAETRW